MKDTMIIRIRATSPVSDLTMEEADGAIRMVVSTSKKRDTITLAPSGKVGVARGM